MKLKRSRNADNILRKGFFDGIVYSVALYARVETKGICHEQTKDDCKLRKIMEAID